MSTMIERVARALAENRLARKAAAQHEGCACLGPAEYCQCERARDLADASAAIAAMREPDEGMLAATEKPGTWGAEPRFVVPVGYENGPIYREQCTEIYQAMIDDALQGEPEA